jgi:nitroreductase
MYQEPIDETMAARYSCRSYDGRPVGQEERKAMEAFIAAEGRDHRGQALKLALVEDKSLSGASVRLGTYGTISGASLYLAGSLPRKDPSLEGFGFAFEKCLLYATELGLASCWLAGTFDRKAFSRGLGLGPGDMIPAVSPLGYPASTLNFTDSVARSLVRSRTRKAPSELFFGEDGRSPLPAEASRSYAAPLEALRLAPSARNIQPWRLTRFARGFRFFIKRSFGYKLALGFDLQRMDLGIAMCHFQLSAAQAGMRGRWEYESPSGSGPEGSEYLVSWIEE